MAGETEETRGAEVLRRAADARIVLIERRMEKFEGLLAENTTATKAGGETIKEVRDILTTFKTLGALAKWLGAIIAAVASAWIAIKGLWPNGR